jgi:hypothetical protein
MGFAVLGLYMKEDFFVVVGGERASMYEAELATCSCQFSGDRCCRSSQSRSRSGQLAQVKGGRC